MLVERAIHQRIRAEVIRPRDVPEFDGGKMLAQLPDLLHKGKECGHADFVFALELTDDQFGIQMAHQPVGMIAVSDFESLDQRTVFRHVIRLDPYAFGVLAEHRSAARVLKDTPDGRLSGVPPGSSVRKKMERSADGLGLIVHGGLSFQRAPHQIRDEPLAFADAWKHVLKDALELCGKPYHGFPWYAWNALLHRDDSNPPEALR